MKKRSVPPHGTPMTSRRYFRIVLPVIVTLVILLNIRVKQSQEPEIVQSQSLVQSSGAMMDANGPVPDYSVLSSGDDICKALVNDPRWSPIARQVWERNKRAKEDLPQALDDPVVMVKTKSGEALSKPFAMCTLAKNGCSHWRR